MSDAIEIVQGEIALGQIAAPAPGSKFRVAAQQA